MSIKARKRYKEDIVADKNIVTVDRTNQDIGFAADFQWEFKNRIRK